MGCNNVPEDPNTQAERTDLDDVFNFIEKNGYFVTSREKFATLKPTSAAKCPYKVALKKGKTYFYCTCGLSKKQPFCDGSHKTTEFKPLKFVAEKEEAYLCGCKRNKVESGPNCDGSHTKIVDW